MILPTPILLTNDDGIDAPGIRALHDAFGNTPTLIAPSTVRSGCSHAITMESRLEAEVRSPAEISVSGTPADCVRLALHGLMEPPALVLSGINEGGNLGHDIYLSGTVAAAREAAFYGVPSIAVSRYFKADETIDWPRTTRLAREVIETLLPRETKPGEFWNINLPHLEAGAPDPEVVFCERCTRALPLEYHADAEGYYYRRGFYHTRDRDPGADVEVCFSGKIAVTLLRI